LTDLRPPKRTSVIASASGHISWRKGDLIGTGANGRVYLGLEEDTGAIIAVKEVMFTRNVQDLKERAQMQEEIELLRSLHHPNIVTYLGTDVCDDDQTLYIFTEWVPGGSIQALVTKFGRLSEAIVRKYVAQLLVGLNYLHGQQVLHRDIKAANILVDDRGTIKLADFGSSKRMSPMGTIDNQNFSLRGTPYFMAPEVIMQTGHGRKADIWSAGCTILQMVTGQPPWKCLKLGSPAALMFHIANADAPPPLPLTLSKALKDLLLATFSRDTNKRPTAGRLLAHPFVTKHKAATVAIAAGALSLPQNKPLSAPPPITLTASEVRYIEMRQKSNVEEAADRTLACQTTGLLCDDSDSARGFLLESFRMPSEDTVDKRAIPPGGTSVCLPRGLETRPGFKDEALVTMFISKEAAAQFAGAEKGFPGRPPTQQPAPNRLLGGGSGNLESYISPSLPCKNKFDQTCGSRRTIGGNKAKSPLLMAQLPPRKQ